MSKFNALNQLAAKFGLSIVGSHVRENRYALFSATTMRRTPDVTIEIIEEWLDALKNEEKDASTLSLLELVDIDAANDERERQFQEMKAFIDLQEAKAKKAASDE